LLDNVELHPLVKKIAKSFSLEKSQLVMTPEKANELMGELAKLKQADREPVAVNIVALAQRFRAEGGRSVEGALGLLVAFTVAAFGDPKTGAAKAADMFGDAGMHKEAAAVIGVDGTVKAPAAAPVKAIAAPIKAKRGLSKN
jgi:hypothetical protein